MPPHASRFRIRPRIICHHISSKKWHQYLLGRKFRIFTDQKSIKHLLSQVVQTPEQYRWATKLIGFDFEIFYKPGKENKVADALGRIEDASLFALSSTEPTWFQELCAFYTTNDGKSLLSKLVINADTTFSFRDGLLYNKTRLFIPEVSNVCHQLLEEYHSTPLEGHSGVAATTCCLASTF